MLVQLATAAALIYCAYVLTLRPLGETDEAIPGEGYSLFIPRVPPGLPAPVDAAFRRVAAVIVRLPGKDRAFGSAFVPMDGTVVTAAHVVAEDDVLGYSVFCNEEEKPATLRSRDPDRDIAILDADCTADELTYELSEPDAQMPLFITGYDFSAELSDGAIAIFAAQYFHMSSPIPQAWLPLDESDDPESESAKNVVKRMEDIGAAPLRAITASIEHGNSGSPVYTRTGALYGMAVISDQGRNRTFIVPAESLRRAITGPNGP